MKRLGFPIAFLLVATVLANPAQAETVWTDRTLYVQDEFAGTAAARPLKAWRLDRNIILRKYSAAGFEFVVTETKPGVCGTGRLAGLAPQTLLICNAPNVTVWSWGHHQDTAGIAMLSWRSPNLLCHEIGHALGLSHRDDRGSCMSPWPVSPFPDEHDISTLGIGATTSP